MARPGLNVNNKFSSLTNIFECKIFEFKTELEVCFIHLLLKKHIFSIFQLLSQFTI